MQLLLFELLLLLGVDVVVPDEVEVVARRDEVGSRARRRHRHAGRVDRVVHVHDRGDDRVIERRQPPSSCASAPWLAPTAISSSSSPTPRRPRGRSAVVDVDRRREPAPPASARCDQLPNQSTTHRLKSAGRSPSSSGSEPRVLVKTTWRLRCTSEVAAVELVLGVEHHPVALGGVARKGS